MSYYNPQQTSYGVPPQAGGAQNLQFYPTSYDSGVSGSQTPQQAYGFAPQGGGQYGAGPSGFNSGFGGAGGVSGRMGEQGGLRTGWVAAFSTEGYDGEPPLLVELGVNFSHIQAKVRYRPGRAKTKSGVATAQAKPAQAWAADPPAKLELTTHLADPRRPQPFQAHRSTHHGRL